MHIVTIQAPRRAGNMDSIVIMDSVVINITCISSPRIRFPPAVDAAEASRGRDAYYPFTVIVMLYY